ncbi:hypothetical protein ECDEC10B_0035 [Escherichia coli DEC10B]|uniref:Uncharacterized protein n=1 Tax=Escherichia coli DEC2D TaxID=868141 RepID=A0A828UF73_ECOLX|nr:hypothetical protein ECDEC1A_5116 [Escherichia coli DEC1A]EHU49375.1 hypothetical protein ECDEC2D_0048 [Escherichia coli DEC2D]EHV41963.1 hypothetical protein ECDEC5E_5475 [Escherichia coli DEC5E]EHV50374.1 hypothetical protein ECDEC6A_5182 [Escherichia coli DEC6A]EHW26539.1 hypothetical protein ECDEC8C_0032 [Escherichia coli DEC8C]EHW71899.1 hypothetical protein ECDEC10D_5653 [Escherichia coli DEC10D]EHW79997.1 hypothetical protein ECDEC10B_0035 [Escherichia coli DEC10B]EMX27249.1 hypoth
MVTSIFIYVTIRNIQNILAVFFEFDDFYQIMTFFLKSQ